MASHWRLVGEKEGGGGGIECESNLKRSSDGSVREEGEERTEGGGREGREEREGGSDGRGEEREVRLYVLPPQNVYQQIARGRQRVGN